MKILMTGSSGFIGQHLTARLKDHNVHHMVSDLREHKAVTDEVIAIKPDIIVHLAARTEVEQSFYEQITFSEINYVGTVNLIEAAAKVKNLKNFVFASTMEVYGWQPISDEVEKYSMPDNFVAFDENTQPNPNAPYGNFIHVTDMLDAWQTVIENPDKCNDGMIFTIGPNNPIKIKDYAELIASKIGFTGKINWDTKLFRAGEIYWLNSNNTLITERLGWEPKVSLDEGLDKTIDYWRGKLEG